MWPLAFLGARQGAAGRGSGAFGSPARLALVLFWLTVLACQSPANAPAQSAPPKPKRATLKISGYGFLGDRELKRILSTLELEGKKPEFFSASFVEDAALVLASRVRRDGYLRPSIQISLQLDDGRSLQVEGDSLIETPLPRPLRIVSARFHIHRGVLYYFKSLDFRGLSAVPEKTARSYFMETESLFSSKRGRAYTPDRVQQGISSLKDALDRLGYQDAEANSATLQQDDRSGAVVVSVTVHEGPKYIIHSIREHFIGGMATNQDRVITPNHPYSRIWLQDFVLGIKTNQFHLGYPGTTVEIQNLPATQGQPPTQKDLLALVTSGPQVRIGAVEFSGAKRTNKRLLKRSVRITRGELLDPTRVEQGRYRLARLGVFDAVDLSYRPEDEHTRDVLYTLQEGKRINLSLLFGWGSYELLRGGVDLEANNLWGEAHHLEVKAIQSFKASSGDFTYTVPELVGDDIDLFVNGSGLRRQEVGFIRLEYGGGIGLHKYFQPLSTDVSARYSYQILNASDFSAVQEVATEGLTNPAVGAVSFEIKHDRRDNPLYPRKGYKVFLTLETATTYLGGDANYQRVEIMPSWHHPLGNGLFLSVGLSHGIVDSFGSPANNLPFNKRFFPGGENSIRGYQEGEASPRNAFGQLVGAETYSLASVELEQALTPRWSVVIFSDSLGEARRLDHYPFDTGLFSVGGGLRLRTIIGPIRLEYGHNLNPRPGDPSGTLQFSLGFPF
ncbi:MAG TPA: BamA/TamA family outer membrane protein [Verrucomicrobiae bacterium]|nr:BamA/TamA family outer membrane protein [Verrucomicrobiae bacterium]